MKSIISFVTLVLLYSQTYGQSGWETQCGGYVNNMPYFADVFFTDDNTGWILTQKDIRSTIDGGNTWSTRFFNDTVINSAYKIFFINPQSGWVAANRFMKTTSGGLNWQILDINTLKSIFFINELTGWGCGAAGMLKKTTDGAATWSDVTTGQSENFNSVYFINVLTGFVAADWGKILKTTNSGQSWTMFVDNTTYSFLQNIVFINNTTGFICGSYGYVFMTTNTGANWSIINTGSYTVLKDISFVNQQTGYIAGYTGNVFRTTNGGLNWVKTLSAGLTTNVYVIEHSSGGLWAVTDSSSVFKSIDQAASWTEKFKYNVSSSSLKSIRFVNQLTGCACGTGGEMLRTSTGGDIWKKVPSSTTLNLNSLFFTDQLTGYACGGDGDVNNVVIKTINSGLNWTTIFNTTVGSLNSLHFIGQNTGWTCSNNGWIAKTTNGGITWFLVFSNPAFQNIKDIEFINQNTGFAVRSAAGYIKSTNGGQNWIEYAGTVIGNQIQFLNELTGFYIGYTGITPFLMKTSDGGNNWASYNAGSHYLYSLFFASAGKGWVAGIRNAGKIRHTTNGGVNWSTQIVYPNVAAFNSVFFVNEFEGWACGESGTIIHTSTAGIGIEKISSEIPLDFCLFQNYPNPFNPATRIRFSVPSGIRNESSNVRLSVFDISGREVTVLLNKPLQPGVYEIDFDGSEYASGFYFCQLRSADFVQTRKMVLLK